MEAEAAGLPCCGLIAFATSRNTMDGRADSLVMTVHLLAKSGHASLLQQTLDQLQKWVCLHVRLFLVSERTSPVKYYETYRHKSARFPGTSVLLFLHEDLGEKRIFQVHDFFQHPPWQHVHMESFNGKLSYQALGNQDFYGLDELMPVWGVRQVHYGTEILRVTLYCSFNNYMDAVRLYEMILQKEATVQKSSFCAFVLYATKSIAVQLCLKQLPLGTSVDLKESSVLQFKVHEIGQLVPLLPNPCVPISSTRWQTEDYEGNRILLQVQGSSKHTGSQDSLSSWHDNANKDGLPQYSNPSLSASRRTVVQQKNRTLRAMKNKHKSVKSGSEALGSTYYTSCSSSHLYSPGDPCLPAQVPSHRDGNRRFSSHELWISREEEETNVDTGYRVAPLERRASPLSRFPTDLEDGLPQCPTSSSSWHLEEKNQLSLPVAKRNKESGHRPFGSQFGRSSATPRKDEEEEFFI